MVNIILIVAVVFIGCIVPLSQYGQIKAAEDPREKIVPMLARMGEAYNFSDTELKVLQDKGLQGDPEAARRLFLYYDLYKRDYKEGYFWKMIAAENGNPSGEYNYGFVLKDDPDPRNKKRAIFWLKRAAKHGVTLAVSLLKELGEEPTEK